MSRNGARQEPEDMQTKLDEAKAELLARAARVAENSPAGGQPPVQGPGPETLTAYLQHYYLHTPPEDLADRDPVDVFGAALSHYRLAEARPQGTANVRVHTPTVEEHGWTCSHSVVEVVTDDMPFLVDSVTNELTRQGRGIHVVIHPQVIVRRDITGKLIELLDASSTARPARTCRTAPSSSPGSTSRSTGETDRGDLKQITADLLRVLSDVREAVEDWDKMRQSALRDRRGAAGASPRPPVRDQEVDRGPSSCCAGSPTTTSPSSATASTS
jgi:glutamate dehydrogenase